MKIKVIKSRKRRKTASAQIKNNFLEIRLPSSLSSRQEEEIIKNLLKKIQSKNKIRTDNFLLKRAIYLYKKFFPPPLPSLTVSWSLRQKRSFGSCQPKKKIIRINHRLKKAPLWVIDYLLIHEMAHLLFPHHQKKFWQLVNRYPKTERARGFLAGYQWGLNQSKKDSFKTTKAKKAKKTKPIQ